jgi:hypothetical protein
MDVGDASSAEMRRRPSTDPLALDDASFERLLSGTLPAAAAPPGYAGVARLLAATVAPPTPRELAGQAAVLAELRALTRGRRATALAGPARPRRRRAGLAVVVVVGALATGGVAAATGHLPGPVREAARSVLGPGGGPSASSSPAPVAPPGAGTAGSGGTGPGGTASTAGAGPRSGPAAAGPAAGPALDGLCQAFLAGNGSEQGKLDAAAFKKLAAAAGGDDRVEVFCEELLAADVQVKGPKESKPKDPPNDGGQDQGGAPPSSGGGGTGGGSGTGGSGSGQDQGSPPADPSASNTPAKNDGASDE